MLIEGGDGWCGSNCQGIMTSAYKATDYPLCGTVLSRMLLMMLLCVYEDILHNPEMACS